MASASTQWIKKRCFRYKYIGEIYAQVANWATSYYSVLVLFIYKFEFHPFMVSTEITASHQLCDLHLRDHPFKMSANFHYFWPLPPSISSFLLLSVSNLAGAEIGKVYSVSVICHMSCKMLNHPLCFASPAIACQPSSPPSNQPNQPARLPAGKFSHQPACPSAPQWPEFQNLVQKLFGFFGSRNQWKPNLVRNSKNVSSWVKTFIHLNHILMI